jgi:hypothetical protein
MGSAELQLGGIFCAASALADISACCLQRCVCASITHQPVQRLHALVVCASARAVSGGFLYAQRWRPPGAILSLARLRSHHRSPPRHAASATPVRSSVLAASPGACLLLRLRRGGRTLAALGACCLQCCVCAVCCNLCSVTRSRSLTSSRGLQRRLLQSAAHWQPRPAAALPPHGAALRWSRRLPTREVPSFALRVCLGRCQGLPAGLLLRARHMSPSLCY